MKITFDSEAQASYIYFTSIEPGGAVKTFAYLHLDVGIDDGGQIATMRLFENDECRFQNRLNYVLQHKEVEFDQTTGSILIAFSEQRAIATIIAWNANIDLDRDGQILGIEILFADPEYDSDDGTERLYAENKLGYLSKYIVAFDSLY